MRVPRSFVVLVAAVTCALLLAGCAGADEAGGGPAGANDADAAFATGMIAHHRQAVQMTDIAEQRADDARVLRLAKEIKYAQQPEIDTMSGWLSEWGEPVPSPGATVAGAEAGAPSAQQLARLEHAHGQAFDRLWLRLMLAHHRGALALAQTEVDEGEDGAALALAEDITNALRSEMERMRWLLAGGLSEGGGGIGW